MGSQNWCFGDPRTLPYTSKPLFVMEGPMILRAWNKDPGTLNNQDSMESIRGFLSFGLTWPWEMLGVEMGSFHRPKKP